MIDFFNLYTQYTTTVNAILILVIGLIASKLISSVSGKIVTVKLGSHIGSVTRNIVFYVLDISLLSTRIRTFDNRYLRIPNSSVANARIVNISRYEIRRLDIPVGIAYKENIQKALEILDSVIKSNENILLEPEPLINITKFGESSIDLEVRVWIQRSKLFSVRTKLIKGIKNAFDEAGIEIPFPHRTVYFGDDGTVEIKRNAMNPARS
jgi:small-conductance mechanosensitive channel